MPRICYWIINIVADLSTILSLVDYNKSILSYDQKSQILLFYSVGSSNMNLRVKYYLIQL